MPDIDPQAIIILVVMIIGGLRWLFEQMKKTQEQGDEDDAGPFVELEEMYEEARREIQERQGRMLPDEEEVAERLEEYQPGPPPLVVETPGTVPPPLPPVPRAAPTPSYAVPDFSPKPAQPVLSVAEEQALQRVQAKGLPRRTTSRRPTRGRSRVRDLLSTPSAARDAIVLREILGPPKGAA